MEIQTLGLFYYKPDVTLHYNLVKSVLVVYLLGRTAAETGCFLTRSETIVYCQAQMKNINLNINRLWAIKHEYLMTGTAIKPKSNFYNKTAIVQKY